MGFFLAFWVFFIKFTFAIGFFALSPLLPLKWQLAFFHSLHMHHWTCHCFFCTFSLFAIDVVINFFPPFPLQPLILPLPLFVTLMKLPLTEHSFWFWFSPLTQKWRNAQCLFEPQWRQHTRFVWSLKNFFWASIVCFFELKLFEIKKKEKQTFLNVNSNNFRFYVHRRFFFEMPFKKAFHFKNCFPQKTDKLGFLKKIFCLQNLKNVFVCYCIAHKFFWGE